MEKLSFIKPNKENLQTYLLIGTFLIFVGMEWE